MQRRRLWGFISVSFALTSRAAAPIAYRLIPAGGLKPKATQGMKPKRLIESLTIPIPGTNIAGHVSGSREIKNGNEDFEVRNDVVQFSKHYQEYTGF